MSENMLRQLIFRKYSSIDIQVLTPLQRTTLIREVLQECLLYALSRTNFFDHAAFYGGTALRIFYKLPRFSEDLDFSLTSANPDFDITRYFNQIHRILAELGLSIDIQVKHKTKKSTIQSAFLKGNTRIQILTFYLNEEYARQYASNETVTIKFEVDTDPPEGASYKHHFSLYPIPYEVNLYDGPSLFAGKLHAVLCRNWKSRTKGRDLYDYVFYRQMNIPFNREHLRQRLIQSHFIDHSNACTLEEIKSWLNQRFDTIDYTAAKTDVFPFIENPRELDVWSADFFKAITCDLHTV